MTEGRRSFSFSRLQAFRNCPLRYRFVYLDDLPEQGLAIESYLGRRLHESLEWLYVIIQRGEHPSLDALLDSYRQLWKKSWSGKEMIVSREWDTDDYYQLGQRILAGYYRDAYPFSEPVETIEQLVEVDLPGDEGYRMRAVIDRLDRHDDGWIAIHDYKSGRKVLTLDQAAKDLQMRIYFLVIVLSTDDLTRIDIVWHYLRYRQQLVLENVDWQANRIISGLKRRINRVRRAEEHPGQLAPKESALCHWCYYWDQCSARAGEIHPARLAG